MRETGEFIAFGQQAVIKTILQSFHKVTANIAGADAASILERERPLMSIRQSV